MRGRGGGEWGCNPSSNKHIFLKIKSKIITFIFMKSDRRGQYRHIMKLNWIFITNVCFEKFEVWNWTLKELRYCHRLWFSNFYIFTTQCRRPLIFQTNNSARSYNISLKYLRLTPSGSIDIGIRKFEFVAKTLFLCINKVHCKHQYGGLNVIK